MLIAQRKKKTLLSWRYTTDLIHNPCEKLTSFSYLKKIQGSPPGKVTWYPSGSRHFSLVLATRKSHWNWPGNCQACNERKETIPQRGLRSQTTCNKGIRERDLCYESTLSGAPTQMLLTFCQDGTWRLEKSNGSHVYMLSCFSHV